ncbi:MAG: nucleotidyltransferase family protein [Thermodesulfobacteriota bacterium]
MILSPTTNATPLPEADAILSVLAGGAWQPGPGVNRDRLCTFAASQGVAGLLFEVLKAGGTPEIPACLERAYYAAAARNTLHIHALARLEKALAGSGVQVMALKGAALLFSAYPDPGLRPMEDLDLLVRPEDRTRFATLLAGLGYRAHPDRSNLFSDEVVRLDIHCHALNADRVPGRTGLLPAGMAPLWELSLPLGQGHRNIVRPCDADLTLLLCQHALKHSYARLIWLVDIHRMLYRPDAAFFRDLARRARELSQEKPLAYSLYIIRDFFRFSVPAELRAFVAGINAPERFLLDIKCSREPFGLLGEMLCLLALPGVHARLRFAADVLFPREGPETVGWSGVQRLIGRIGRATALALGQANLLVRAARRPVRRSRTRNKAS